MPIDVDFTQVDLKLGKKLGVVHDRRTLSLLNFTTLADRKEAPVKHRVGGLAAKFPMFKNDEYGICTLASTGHQTIAWERSAFQSMKIDLTDEQLMKAYSDITGFDPNRPETDNGAYMLDVENYRRRVGVGLDEDGTPHKIGAFYAVPTSLHSIRYGSWSAGGLHVGAGLPISASRQLRRGEVWDVVSGSDGSWGSWGGHAMYQVAYDEDGVTFVTWSRLQRATWAWFFKYVDETYAAVSQDFLRHNGKTPQGFDVDALNEALVSLR